MTLDPEIRDQAYQFFIEEVPEHLEAIETGLVNLHQDVSPAQLHSIMRAAHSIKGGAAGVELNGIKSLAHRLETIIKALYSNPEVLGSELESKLFQAYDCLRIPLEEQVNTGHYDEEQALQSAEPIFLDLEQCLGPALARADDFILSSSDLGIDMVSSIFEVDVQQVLEHLQKVVDNPHTYELIGEIRAQTEVFEGFAELLGLPGFGKICEVVKRAVDVAPHKSIVILQQSIADFSTARERVLAGDRNQGGEPSEALLALAGLHVSAFDVDISTDTLQKESTESLISDSEISEFDLTAIFGEEDLSESGIDSEDIESESVSVDGEMSLECTQDSGLTAPILNDAECLQTAPNSSVQSASTPALVEYDIETFFEEDEKADFSNSDDFVDYKNLLGIFDEDDESPIPSKRESRIPGAFLSHVDDEVKDNVSDHSEIEKQCDVINEEKHDVINTIESSSSDFDAHTESLEPSIQGSVIDIPQTLDDAIQSVGDIYDTLPIAAAESVGRAIADPPHESSGSALKENPRPIIPRQSPQKKSQLGKTLTARIALDRLERLDNFVGELAINRNSLSLQNDQFQRTVRHLKKRFDKFRNLAKRIQSLSDKMLVNPKSVYLLQDHPHPSTVGQTNNYHHRGGAPATTHPFISEVQFDALELDSYNTINLLLEELLEELLQVEESIEDVHLFAGQSNQKLEKQRQLLTQLRNELMWSRMVPLSGVLNRFPRVLRELSSSYGKPAELKLVGTEVLVDRVILEKLYDPLLHLLRNAFDHGLESPEERESQGKSAQGTIEIRAYHQGNSTVVEIADDGRGLDIDRIGQRAIEAGLITKSELPTLRKQQLYTVIFEPGFSTAPQVSDLSGRGVGLDVVRERLQSFNGKITLTSEPGQGTTFQLRIPLTLSLAKIIVFRVGSTLMAIPSDGIEEILTPLESHLKKIAGKQFLHWRGQLLPTYVLKALLPYACPMSEKVVHDVSSAVAKRYRSAKPMLIIRRTHEALALEVDQIITEQELVIKPFGKAIAAPDYINGCTVLGDGRLVPVVDGVRIVGYSPRDRLHASQLPGVSDLSVDREKSSQQDNGRSQSSTILIIDDSTALRRTLALTLQKAGYRVAQAKDGREALDQLQQRQDIELIVCDIEMPRMNGFEFLSQRRLTPEFANIPTVMLTSRSSQKHRRLAFQLGATDYFSKPYIEAEFLSAIKTYFVSELT
ncbi:MAG: hybrid sensor histidine kinase/response regulator [Leptolyngbyaceae bacterium]|nr:hybrid sensor histidine kinase/response regulator [Leptolyngbyaceae bacterium]